MSGRTPDTCILERIARFGCEIIFLIVVCVLNMADFFSLETFLGDANCLKAFRHKGQPAASDA